MALLRHSGREDSVLDGVSPASLGDFGLIPSPLGGEGQGEGAVTSLPGECRPTCEWHGFAMQDTRTPSSVGFRRRCAAWRVTLERPKVTKGLHPHLFALLRRVPSVPPFVPRHAPMGHPWPSGARSASCLAAWTNGLASANNRGATANPQRRGRLTGVGCTKRSALHRGNTPLPIRGRVVVSQPTPRPPHGEIRLSHLCNKNHRHGCIGEKIMVGTTTSGRYPYRETALY